MYESVVGCPLFSLRQVSTRNVLTMAGKHDLPEATQSSVPAVHVLFAAHVCTSAVPPVVPVGSEQRVSTWPRSLPFATAGPTHSTQAFATVAPRLVVRQTASPVHAVVPLVGNAPCAVHVPNALVPVKGVPGTGMGAPTQTTALGMH